MKRENADQKGQKDNFSSQPHTHTHAWGTNQDTDLEWIPDNEVFFEGSETLVPLPLFCDREYNWPMILKRIVEKGTVILFHDRSYRSQKFF